MKTAEVCGRHEWVQWAAGVVCVLQLSFVHVDTIVFAEEQ
jgi:hypothetical protein